MRIGTDIVEIERIRQACLRNSRFFAKILTGSELERYTQLGEQRQVEFLAGRFSAKEAYVKALETGIGKIRFTDIEIGAKPSGAPCLIKAPIVDGVQLSISHSQAYATATVLIELDEATLQAQLARL